jgi:predicted kinase
LEVLGDRLSKRQNDISDATPDLLANQQAIFEDFTENERQYLTVVDTGI